MGKELIQAFEDAGYKIVDPPIEIKIKKLNPEVDKLVMKYNMKRWALITPFNPHSEVMPDEENEKRLKELREDVAQYITFDTTAGGGDKPVERGLFILGIGPINARVLGRRYEQDAIVYGRIKKTADVEILSEDLKKVS